MINLKMVGQLNSVPVIFCLFATWTIGNGLTDVPQTSSVCNVSLSCDALQIGQYYCSDPVIDPETQQEYDCSQADRHVNVLCYPVAGICCSGRLYDGVTHAFTKKVPCNWTNGKKFSVALLLSIFLGWLGIDRFYLGYPALGMLKFCTFGFMLIWTLADILLIAIQVVRPADGSDYIVDRYGPGLIRIDSNNMTYVLPPGT